jgi:hypothetical protein
LFFHLIKKKIIQIKIFFNILKKKKKKNYFTILNFLTSVFQTLASIFLYVRL